MTHGREQGTPLNIERFYSLGRGAMMSRQALLVMDYQAGVVEGFGNDQTLLERVLSGITAARSANVLVIYVRVGFRPGSPEINSSNKIFSNVKAAGDIMDENDPSTQIVPTLAPRSNEVVVTKRRVGAFAGTELETVLRSNGVDTLTLAGIATSGVVLSTLRWAADFDYKITVLADCCLDGDPEVHRLLLDKVFPAQADVLDVQEWIQRIEVVTPN
jgi:nicotinamidase-related amidase